MQRIRTNHAKTGSRDLMTTELALEMGCVGLPARLLIAGSCGMNAYRTLIAVYSGHGW